jgi:hypothetical protein
MRSTTLGDKNKSFVHENTEVVMTGRKATKALRSGKEEILFEITPISSMVGSWKKWVMLSQMFEVVDEEGEE